MSLNNSLILKKNHVMKKIIIYFGFIVFLFSSCASSYLKDSSNISKEKKTYDKVLIVAKAKDKVARIKFEDQLVKDLSLNGVNAVSSISVINTESFNKELSEDDIEKLREKLINDGYDGVIITNLIDKQQYTDVNSGNISTAYVPIRYGRFGRYYSAYPVSYWGEDEISVGIEYTLESCLYNLSTSIDNNLQWVGRFKVKDPSSLIKFIEKYSKELTTELLENSISN